MDHATYLRRWSALHGGASPTGLVGGWLRLVHVVATPLAKLRVPPDLLTLAGLGIACAAPVLASGDRVGLLLAAGVVALSGLTDSLDGAVAVMTGRTTRWGAVLDAVADRISDAAFVAALWVAGAPGGLCVVAAGLGWLQEYARARAGQAGLADVAVVTVNERPTRVLVVVMFLAATAARPADEPGWAAGGAATLALLGVVGLVQLLVAVRHRLVRS